MLSTPFRTLQNLTCIQTVVVVLYAYFYSHLRKESQKMNGIANGRGGDYFLCSPLIKLVYFSSLKDKLPYEPVCQVGR